MNIVKVYKQIVGSELKEFEELRKKYSNKKDLKSNINSRESNSSIEDFL